jgi:hypothetical protein
VGNDANQEPCKPGKRKIDHRALLKKYMNHVATCEGTNFVSSAYHRTGSHRQGTGGLTVMKNHLALYDKHRSKPPAFIWLANGDRLLFMRGDERENYLDGLEISSVTPPLDEWPPPLLMAIKLRMLRS